MKLTGNLDKFGTAGLFLTAIFSPCCFPVFAFAASALGLGSFELFGAWTMWIFETMVLITIGGLYISYRRHRCLYPLMLAVPGGIFIISGFHFVEIEYWDYFLYAGMLGLLSATIWNYRRNKLHNSCGEDCHADKIHSNKKVELKSTIKCPECGHEKTEIMPTDACVYFYECDHCKTRLKPMAGDCCVYCSYGSVKCPPKQTGNDCC